VAAAKQWQHVFSEVRFEISGEWFAWEYYFGWGLSQGLGAGAYQFFSYVKAKIEEPARGGAA
jgi:hypothetical protein